MQKQAAYLMVTVLLLGLFLMRESREGTGGAIDTAYGDWVATNTTRTVPPARVVLVEINDSSLAGRPWPWAPTEYTLFLEDVLPYKPEVVAIEPALNWEGVSIPGSSRQKIEQDEKFLHDYVLKAPKLVLGSQLGSPDDAETVPPLLPVPLLRNVKGDIRAIPIFTDISAQAAEDYRLSASVGFTNLPPGKNHPQNPARIQLPRGNRPLLHPANSSPMVQAHPRRCDRGTRRVHHIKKCG